jgi:hypothetical protein
MVLLRKIPFKNIIYVQVILTIIILISICFIGYMFGKFLWYLSH